MRDTTDIRTAPSQFVQQLTFILFSIKSRFKFHFQSQKFIANPIVQLACQTGAFVLHSVNIFTAELQLAFIQDDDQEDNHKADKSYKPNCEPKAAKFFLLL